VKGIDRYAQAIFKPGYHLAWAMSAGKEKRKANMIIAIAGASVALLSPLSVVVALLFGWRAQDWLSFWQHYVFFFILAAFLVAVLGVAAASEYWAKEVRGRRSQQQG
jgi:fatty acid desaturase